HGALHHLEPTLGKRRPATRAPRLAVPKENILQLLPDAVVPTRDELAAYWRTVADRALEYLGRRPLKLVRSVHGTTFYHMGRLPPIPPAVHQLRIEKRKGGEGTRVWVDDLEGCSGSSRCMWSRSIRGVPGLTTSSTGTCSYSTST